jgi:hypothetical protein
VHHGDVICIAIKLVCILHIDRAGDSATWFDGTFYYTVVLYGSI